MDTGKKEAPPGALGCGTGQDAYQQHNHHTTAGSPVELVLSRLDKVRQAGPSRWMACCPAHDDKTPSLSIRETGDGTCLLKCFAGCTAGDVVSSIGLSLRDLFPDSRCCPSAPGRPSGGRGSGLSARRRRELEDALLNERLILRMAAADIRAGRASQIDAERAGTAMERVRKIRRLLHG